jgi:tRNA/rRNA methyltransferase
MKGTLTFGLRGETQGRALRDAPAVILVRPQLAENIGTVARAMLNFGLSDLRLVNPRDGWPSTRALAAASGADEVIEGARLFSTTKDAIAELELVYATTARPRDMLKPVASAESAAREMIEARRLGQRAGVLFGAERAGLTNDDVTLAQRILEIPVNPVFSSLNLAQAVLIVAYEWARGMASPTETIFEPVRSVPASMAELIGFFEQLEAALDISGFLRPREKRPAMVRNLRNLFQRALLTEQEVRTLRGVISALTRRGGDNSRRDPGKGEDL